MTVAIDYPLILGHTALDDHGIRGEISAGLEDLPFDNLWVRASGFGSDSAPASTRRYITALWGLHNLGKPIIADYLGGLVGLASIAFGAVCGVAHGIGPWALASLSEEVAWRKHSVKSMLHGKSGHLPDHIGSSALAEALRAQRFSMLGRPRRTTRETATFVGYGKFGCFCIEHDLGTVHAERLQQLLLLAEPGCVDYDPARG